MPAKKIDGDGSTSTRLSRASNCSLLLRVKRGQASAPGIIVGERGHHLAAVADAEREHVGAGEEGRELVGELRH